MALDAEGLLAALGREQSWREYSGLPEANEVFKKAMVESLLRKASIFKKKKEEEA